MSHPHWWDELAASVEAAGHARFSADWYAGMRDAHAARFPNADQRTKDNMRMLARDAAARESAYCDRGPCSNLAGHEGKCSR